ncbi:MAG: hypothetical protein IKG46_08675 [Solobacterium sp.]|nr:hypothetical protein [Solobacterium sp.]
MGYRRLFIVRKDLHLTAGKMSAQLSHCAEAAWLRYFDSSEITGTIKGDDGQEQYTFEHTVLPADVVDQYVNDAIVKTVCQAKNRTQLLKAGKIAEELGLTEDIDYGFIYNMCLTELQPEEEDGTTMTAFWTAPLPDETAHAISKKFHLYADDTMTLPERMEEDTEYARGWNDCLKMIREKNSKLLK